ncbi:HAMP domain-containing histidine kinase [Candidatus Saccharibacteria bacterium]|nr:HAMP domain-containing histidine kinase [Candidatus Saccharibacteria bacterium]
MYRLSAIIEEVYQKYFLKAEKRGVRFNLDFPDVTRRIERPSLVRKPLEPLLGGAVERAQKEVSLTVARDCIVVRDDGVALAPAKVAELSEGFENVKVRSRVGFGTEIKIFF